MRVLIIGYGEIGKAVHKHFGAFNEMDWLDLDKGTANSSHYDILHVCIPHSVNFVQYVQAYIDRYQPLFTINHSTVPIGTNARIKRNVIHAPVRGRHKNLAKALGQYQMFVSKNVIQSGLDYLMECEVPIVVCDKYETTEAAKLLELLQYGLNVEFARYAKTICDVYGIDYGEAVQEYGKSHNETIRKLDGQNFIKPILEPPEGKIGGHCVLPGVEILNGQVPSELLQSVLKINQDMASLQYLSNR